MTINRQNEVYLLQFSRLSKEAHVTHYITTRKGGISQPPYASLNLGFHSKDNPNDVLQNRIILSRYLGIPLGNFAFSKQVHSGNVHVVSEIDRGKGSDCYDSGIPQSDAMITNIPGISLTVLVADCTPVLFYDKKNRVIGIAHSGRMGVVNRIVIHVIEKMAKEYGSKPESIMVGLGPTICANHYPISQDKASILRSVLSSDTLSINEVNEKVFFDLSTAIREQLLWTGIIEQNIEKINMCTYEEDELFFSERRDAAPTGRFGAIIRLNSEQKSA